MPMVEAPGRSIYAESFGRPDDPALLLISGLGSQMTSWPVDFCEAFTDRGFFVMRFDNRDVGLSTKFSDGDHYTLSEMAEDGIEVMTHFGVERAHVMGSSLGGMIAQTLAIDHPERVLSLTSYISTTGNPEYGESTQEALDALLLPDASTREEAVERDLVGKRIWGTEGAWSVEEFERFTLDNFDRSPPDGGSARQYAAIHAAGDREPALAELTVPTLVIHGELDPLIDASGGRRTAEVVPGATYLEIEGMGHDLPITEWPQIVSAVTAHAVNAMST